MVILALAMRRGILSLLSAASASLFALFILAALFSFALPARAQTQASGAAEAPEALLAHAAMHTNIESPSSMPFVLRAKVRVKNEGRTTEGTYTLGWAAPGLYREDIEYNGGPHETVVAANGKVYRTAVESGFAQKSDLWRRMMKRAMPWTPPAGAVARERKQGQHYSGAEMTCIVAGAGDEHQRICLDPKNYEPYSFDASGPNGKESWTFNGYIALANATADDQRFPSTITYTHRDRNGAALTAEFDVESLAAVSGFGPEEFTPPQNATEDLPAGDTHAEN